MVLHNIASLNIIIEPKNILANIVLIAVPLVR